MWIPTKTYEALPSIYLAVGALFILGAIYIGAGHALMPGYLLVGMSCVTAGVVVWNIRRNARAHLRKSTDDEDSNTPQTSSVY